MENAVWYPVIEYHEADWEKLFELAGEVTIYPQKLVNIRAQIKMARWMYRQSEKSSKKQKQK